MDGLFARSELLLGNDSTDILKKKHAILFGLGGVGSYIAEALARSGIGELTLVDNDTVSPSNRNRQLYALSSTVGMLKTEVAKERIKDINPDCKVNIISKFCLPENIDEFFPCRYDYAADAIDTVSAKIAVVKKCKELGIPLISCMGTGNKLDPSLFRISDIYKTDTCPLCRVMRRELKAHGIDSLRVVWSPEAPCSSGSRTPGSLPFVPPVAGMLAAGEVILNLLRNNI